jgi:hypothetical protein
MDLSSRSQRGQRRTRILGSNETEIKESAMRPYITATGMAFGLLAVWATLVQFVV